MRGLRADGGGLRAEEGLELEADEGALGDDGTMLFLDREEVLVGRAVGEDDGLTTKGANLGATDIEDIAMTGKEGKGDVALRGHEAVAKAGSVDVEGEVVALADGIEVGELAGAVEGAVLGGEGDVDEAGVDAVVAIAVVVVVVEVTIENRGGKLAVAGVREGDDFVLGELDGTGFVDVDVAGGDAEDAFVLIEHGVDGGGVGLGAASEEEDLGVGEATGLADEGTGTVGILVEAVGDGTGGVVAHKGVED